MIKLVEIYKDTVRDIGSWHLREIFINPDYIVFMREDPTMGAHLVHEELPEGLLPQQSFTRIGTNQSKNSADIVVVGALEQVRSKIVKHEERLKNRALLLEG